MRNIYLALLAAFVLLLSACDTSAPKATNTCAKNSTECPVPDDGNPDNDGEDPDNENPDNENPDNENPDDQNPDNENPDNENPDGDNPDGEHPDVFDHSLMKGFVKYLDGSDYMGDKVLKVKALWIDQSNGQIISIGGGDEGSRLELDGEFGVRLKTPEDSSLATVPVLSPITCDNGSIVTTTTPANLSSVKGAIVPVLFVFDDYDQLVGIILHGSIHLDEYGNLIPSAKLAMRVYSAADKIISKGTCSGEIALDSMMAMSDVALGNVLKQMGAANVDATQLAQMMTSGQLMASSAAPKSSGLTVNLNVNLGLKKGWNTVVLGAELSDSILNVSLIDDTKPNFTWYFIDLKLFINPEGPQCPEVRAFNNTGEPVECPVEPVDQ
jgi:hypothetical protein